MIENLKKTDSSIKQDVDKNEKENSLSNSSFSASLSSVRSEQENLQTENHHSRGTILSTTSATITRLKTHVRHKEYELTYDMMLGIRTFVSMSNVNPSKTLDLHLNFKEKKKLYFPSEGSTTTPSHAMRSFSFTDYSSECFKRLREKFGINPADYLIDLCGDFAYLKFQTNSKSGQFFFYSHDRKYLIKTITKEEKTVLRRMMGDYYSHLDQYQNSLLTRFVGLHSVDVKGIGKKYFIIMISVFPPNSKSKKDSPSEETEKGELKMKFLFDLKGSSFGREASEKDKRKETPVLKDNDARNKNFKIDLQILGSTFKKQIKLDAEFLKRNNIIDYSLLVGVVEKEELEQFAWEEKSSITENFKREEENEEIEEIDEEKEENDTEERSEKKHKGKDNYDYYKYKEKKEIKERNIFMQEMGGVAGKEVVYYLGLIDILQEFNTRKRIESVYKGMVHGKEKVSVVDPSFYSKRFVKFIESLVE